MRIIPTRVHGALDYATGLLLILSPWLFGFAGAGPEMVIPVGLGIGAFAYSVITDYELGVVRLLPMKVHLLLDAGSGVLLAASPWLFGFSEEVWLPHLVLGLFEIAAAILTRTHPADRARRSHTA